MRRLADGVALAVLDLRGFGDSDKPDWLFDAPDRVNELLREFLA